MDDIAEAHRLRMMHLIDNSMGAVLTYLARAQFAYKQATEGPEDPTYRSMMLAFCIHACQSMIEACHKLGDNQDEISELIKTIPYQRLVKYARENDIHGNPFPVCMPGAVSGLHSSRQGLTITAANQETVTVLLDEFPPKPLKTRPPYDPNQAKNKARSGLDLGSNYVGFRCKDGVTIAVIAGGTEVKLGEALAQFLTEADRILNNLKMKRWAPSQAPRNPSI